MISTEPNRNNSKGATRKRLIDATARLFAEHGYNGLTIRSVASEAKANLAAANYHFGSKDALVLEMLQERIQPINARRMELLNQAKFDNLDSRLSTFTIFHSLIHPIGEEISKSVKLRSSLAQLVARSFTEPVKFIERMHQQFFSQIAEVYLRELCLSHPQTPRKEIHWHLHLSVSSMLGALAQHRRLNDFTLGNCQENEVSPMIERLIHFVTNGFEHGINQRFDQ